MKNTTLLGVSIFVLAGIPMIAAGQAPPAVVRLSTEIKGVVLVRLKYNTDLLEGLQQAVKDEKIKNVVILTGVGSVTSYHVHAVSSTTLPATPAYSEHAGPMDLIAVNGYVLGGRIHAHIAVTDDKKAFGGHLHEGTNAFTFAIITLGRLEDNIDFSRFDDSNWR